MSDSEVQVVERAAKRPCAALAISTCLFKTTNHAFKTVVHRVPTACIDCCPTAVHKHHIILCWTQLEQAGLAVCQEQGLPFPGAYTANDLLEPAWLSGWFHRGGCAQSVVALGACHPCGAVFEWSHAHVQCKCTKLQNSPDLCTPVFPPHLTPPLPTLRCTRQPQCTPVMQ